MKVNIEFNLPEETTEYKIHNMASDMNCALWDMSNYLRDQIKYNDKLSEEEIQVYEKIREKFSEIIDSYNIDLYL